MFTGIIEATGKVVALQQEGGNLHMTFSSPFTHELKIDQSLAHNGVCLTVVDIKNDQYVVTAIAETLLKTNLGKLRVGDEVNLERCLRLGDRLDGHVVQGHVDTTAICKKVIDESGSWRFVFEYGADVPFVTVPKGSVCINGVSLTVVDSLPSKFSVAIIPYTFEHTNFKSITENSIVNIEFDILGKYLTALAQKLAVTYK